MVSRRLEDKNESLGLGLGLGLGLEEKVLQFFKTFVVIIDGSEQGTPWYFQFCDKTTVMLTRT